MPLGSLTYSSLLFSFLVPTPLFYLRYPFNIKVCTDHSFSGYSLLTRLAGSLFTHVKHCFGI